MSEKKWAYMTPQERAAHARSFIGKKPKPKPSPDRTLGEAIAALSQEQRDAILRDPAINRPRRT